MPYKLASTGKHSGFVWHVRSAEEKKDGRETLFPDRFSLETLNQIREREGDYNYSCNYLNEPIPDLSGALNIKKLKRYTIEDGGTRANT